MDCFYEFWDQISDFMEKMGYGRIRSNCLSLAAQILVSKFSKFTKCLFYLKMVFNDDQTYSKLLSL